ncbi:MAG: NTP transferase domain-containing protein [Phycisphaeraceae bacterium]|nr:NTP transferase domain-containing protein [Phycisphaeraceae bacterium]
MQPSSAADRAVIILAAGRGTRMGIPKPLMLVHGQPWWRTQDAALERASLRRVWVVSPAVASAIAPGPPTRDVVIADDSAPMFASLAAGLHFVRPHPPRTLFILPADVPVPSAEVFHALASAGRAAAPTFGHQRGHPLMLTWDFVEAHILPRAHDPGARLDEISRAHCAAVPVDDPRVLMNLNTPQRVSEYEAGFGL